MNIIKHDISIEKIEGTNILKSIIIILDEEGIDEDILKYRALMELYCLNLKPKKVLTGVVQSIKNFVICANHKSITTEFILKD